MAKAYIDGVFPDGEYNRQKRLLEMELESLVVPAANAAEEAGKLILSLKALWAEANQEERRRLLLSMLDAVYFDTKATKSIVAVRPKPPFKPIFQVAASKEGSGIRIINEPYLGSSVFLVEAGESQTPPETRMRVATVTSKPRDSSSTRCPDETTFGMLLDWVSDGARHLNSQADHS